MIVLYILLALAALLTLILLLPLELWIRYDGKHFALKVGAAGLRFRLLPSLASFLEDETLSAKDKRKILKKLAKKREKAAQKEEKKRRREEEQAQKGKKTKKSKKVKKAAKKEDVAPTHKRKKSVLRDIRFLARAVGILLRKFGRRLSVKLKRLHLTVASDDAAKTAYLFGALSQATAYLLTSLDAFSRLSYRNKNVKVEADFLSETLSADIEILFSIRVGSLLSLAFSAVWLFVKEGMKKGKTNDK